MVNKAVSALNNRYLLAAMAFLFVLGIARSFARR